MPDAQSSNGIPTLFIYAQATRQITILKIERYKYYLRAATQTSNDEFLNRQVIGQVSQARRVKT